jgi:decaprenyl-phosphate phosphoribosyltransferase
MGKHPIWFEFSVIPVVMAIMLVELRFERGQGESPEELALHDRSLQLAGLAWMLLIAMGVYA